MKDPYLFDFQTLKKKAGERNIEAEYALRGISKPIGVAEYQLSRAIPGKIKSDLPTIEYICKQKNQ